MSTQPAEPTGNPPALPGLAEVRYSLPDLLREVQLERSAPAFAAEKLDQIEIANLFRKNHPRRAARTRK